MAEPLGHERQITFFQKDGHDHDGENSSPVKILPGAISLYHLNPALRDWIQQQAVGGGRSPKDDSVMPVPDLEFDTPPIAPGGYHTGVVPWVGIAIVRWVRILMSQDTECTITFYHQPTFLDEDREFRAYQCSNRFLWEGAWAHFDEAGQASLYYKIENTGTQSAAFRVTLKSATMAANAYSRYVEAIQVGGQEVTETVQFHAGNGISIEKTGEAGITFSAVSPETIYIARWTATPVKPVGYASSATISNLNFLTDGRTDRGAGFGSGTQWIQADIGSLMNLAGVDLYFYQPDGRVFNNVVVELSPDGSNWLVVKPAGQVWAVASPLKVTLANGYLARYIRVWCSGSTADANNYINKIIPLAISGKG